MICNMFVSTFSNVVSDYMMKNRIDRYQKLGFSSQMACTLSQWFGTGRFVKNKNTVSKMVSYYKNSEIKLNNAEIFVLMDKGGELPDDYDLFYVRRIFFGEFDEAPTYFYHFSNLNHSYPRVFCRKQL